jgi:glycosyltransferase involved in cell wall biosynthesis
MIKIAISANADISQAYGTTTRAKGLVQILCGKYDVNIIGTRTKNIRVISLLLRNFRLAVTLFRHKFDIVCCADDFWGFPVCYLLSIILRYKTIFDAHAILSEERKQLNPSRIRTKWDQILERFAITKANYVIAVGEDILEFYQKYKHNIGIIPLFTDVSLFKPKNQIGSYTKGYKRLGMIGPFTEEHNQTSLPFIYNNLDKFDKRIRFIVIGVCDNKVQNERIEYTGYLPSITDYISELCQLDAVLDCKEPGTGPFTKVIEAMACGLPVFTIPRAMMNFGKARTEKDLLVFPKDKLVSKINELIFNRELMLEIGHNARVTIEKYYSKTVVSQKLLEVINRLCEKS